MYNSSFIYVSYNWLFDFLFLLYNVFGHNHFSINIKSVVVHK